MPKKGSTVSESTRQKMREARARHKPHIVGRYGLTEETVRENLAAGRIWCSDCKSFLEAIVFGNAKRKTRCGPCSKQRRDKSRSQNPELYRARDREYHRKSFVSGKNAAYQKRYRLARYGVTHEWYEGVLLAQGGVCALCEGPKVGGKAYYCIDHDHTTGKVRGLLCLTCNSALERAESVKGWIDRVRSYLLLHGG